MSHPQSLGCKLFNAVVFLTKSSAFVSYLLEMLEDFGQVRAKAMFGGYGIYKDDFMFAIVVDDTLYIKADNNSRELFAERGLSRFSYLKNYQECFMSYYRAPDEAIDSLELLSYWADIGYQAAMRAYRPTLKSRKKATY